MSNPRIAAGLTGMTLEDLSARVEQELRKRKLLSAQPDGRVTPAPDARTIRYYTTLGLVDRPEMAGREARYGPRHLLQLVAIKALQSLSRPLAEIQAHLYGKTDGELEAVIESLTREAAGRLAPEPPVVRWLELPVEPGLKLLVQEGWTPASDRHRLQERIGAALAAMFRTRSGSNGGTRS